MDVLASALEHGFDPEDALHAVHNALAVDEIGPDRAGNPLDLVVLDRSSGPAIIHAMRMRPQYRRRLPREP